MSVGPCFYSEEFSQVRVNVNSDIIVDIIVGFVSSVRSFHK